MMKTIFRILIITAVFISTFACQAQDWNTTGNNTVGSDWLGTINNQPIPFRTNNVERMRLYPSQTSTINGFTVDQTGYLLLSREPVLFNSLGPFSMLHLGGVQGSMELSFRD